MFAISTENRPSDILYRDSHISRDQNGNSFFHFEVFIEQTTAEDVIRRHLREHSFSATTASDSDEDSSNNKDQTEHSITSIHLNLTHDINDTFASFLILEAPTIESIFLIGDNRGITANFFFELAEKHPNPDLRRQCLRYFPRILSGDDSFGMYSLLSNTALSPYSGIRLEAERPNSTDIVRALGISSKLESMIKYVATRTVFNNNNTNEKNEDAASSLSLSLYNSGFLDFDLSNNNQFLLEDLITAFASTCQMNNRSFSSEVSTSVQNRKNMNQFDWFHPIWCQTFRSRRQQSKNNNNNNDNSSFLAEVLLVSAFEILCGNESPGMYHGGGGNGKRISFYLQRLLLETEGENSVDKVFDMLIDWFGSLDQDSENDLREASEGGFRKNHRRPQNIADLMARFQYDSEKSKEDRAKAGISESDFDESTNNKDDEDVAITVAEDDWELHDRPHKRNKRTFACFQYDSEYDLKLKNIPALRTPEQIKEKERMAEKKKKDREEALRVANANAAANNANAANNTARPFGVPGTLGPGGFRPAGGGATFGGGASFLRGEPNEAEEKVKLRPDYTSRAHIFSQQHRYFLPTPKRLVKSPIVCNEEKFLTAGRVRDFINGFCISLIHLRCRDLFQVVVEERNYLRERRSGAQQFYPFLYDDMDQMNKNFDKLRIGYKILQMIANSVDRYGTSAVQSQDVGPSSVFRMLEALLMDTTDDVLLDGVYKLHIIHRINHSVMSEWKVYAEDEKKHIALFEKRDKRKKEYESAHPEWKKQLEDEETQRQQQTNNNLAQPTFMAQEAKRVFPGFSGAHLSQKSYPQVAKTNDRLFTCSMQFSELVEKLLNPRHLETRDVDKTVDIMKLSNFLFKNDLAAGGEVINNNNSDIIPHHQQQQGSNNSYFSSCPLNFAFELIKLLQTSLKDVYDNITDPHFPGAAPRQNENNSGRVSLSLPFAQMHQVREPLCVYHILNNFARVELVRELACLQHRSNYLQRGKEIALVDTHAANELPIIFSGLAPKLTAAQKKSFTYGYKNILKKMLPADAQKIQTELHSCAGRFYKNIPYLIENFKDDLKFAFESYPFQEPELEKMFDDRDRRNERLRKKNAAKKSGAGDNDDDDANNNNNNNTANANNNAINQQQIAVTDFRYRQMPLANPPSASNLTCAVEKISRQRKPIDDSMRTLKIHCDTIFAALDKNEIKKESGKRRGRNE